MSPLRIVSALLFLISGAVNAKAQQLVVVKDTASAPLDLSGKWRVSRPVVPGFTQILLVQTGNRLQGDIQEHVRCAGRDVTMRVTLVGTVQGREVRLQARTGELEGDFQNRRCNDAVFVNGADFRGEVSPDGRRIKGPYDLPPTPLHVWTFER